VLSSYTYMLREGRLTSRGTAQFGLQYAQFLSKEYRWDIKLNSMVCVRERTIPTERPPLVSELIANFCG
jgi:hypothetical protein